MKYLAIALVLLGLVAIVISDRYATILLSSPQAKASVSPFASGSWKVVGIQHWGYPKFSVELVLQSWSRRERLVVGVDHKGIEKFRLLMPSDTVTFKQVVEPQYALEYQQSEPANNLIVDTIEGVKFGK